MPKIVIVLAVTFAVLGSGSPAMARPGESDGGPADQGRYARCFADALTTTVTDAANIDDAAERARRISGARAAADATCQPRQENPVIPLTETLVAPPGLAGTAIVSCDAQHQFVVNGIGYPYRAADPAITGDTGVVTGGPFPYRASVEPTAPVGGYDDAFYWRINNTTDAPATVAMSITCQRPAGF